MSFYTIVFILVALLILVGLGLFGLMISKIDKWIDKKERLGTQSIYKNESSRTEKTENNKDG